MKVVLTVRSSMSLRIALGVVDGRERRLGLLLVLRSLDAGCPARPPEWSKKFAVLWGSVCALCRDERTSFPHAPTEAPSKSESWPALGEASQEVGAAKRETSSGGVPADFDGYLD